MDKKGFYVMLWDFNTDELVAYDVLPYFRREYEGRKRSDRPKTLDEWRAFVEGRGRSRFWARCEYEFIVSSWPPFPDPDKAKKYKVDAWQQLKPNLDIICEILMTEYKNVRRRKTKANVQNGDGDER